VERGTKQMKAINFFQFKERSGESFFVQIIWREEQYVCCFLKKSLGERSNKNSHILFHVFNLSFEISPLFG